MLVLVPPANNVLLINLVLRADAWGEQNVYACGPGVTAARGEAISLAHVFASHEDESLPQRKKQAAAAWAPNRAAVLLCMQDM